jgi:hypothetical protein
VNYVIYPTSEIVSAFKLSRIIKHRLAVVLKVFLFQTKPRKEVNVEYLNMYLNMCALFNEALSNSRSRVLLM